MTISSTTRKAGPLPGNSVATVFPFAFKVFSKADLVVVLTLIATGVETALTVDVDYTVALNVDQDTNPGGTITYNPSGVPMPATQELTITSNVSLLQTLALTVGGGFSPSAISAALDRAIICIQQTALTISQGLRVTLSDTVPGPLPPKALRTNSVLAFDGNGDPVANGGVASSPVSVAMAPVVSAASLTAARGLFDKAPTTQRLTASGTYTRPVDCLAALVYVKAGGGSGGSSTLGIGRGGGGGEGEEGWRLLTAAQIGASQTVTIGAGGVAQTINTNASGNTGGTTSFGALLTAAGGLGGTSGNNGGAGGRGGTGGTGADYAMPGAPGTSGTDITATAIGTHASGGGKGGAVQDGQAGIANSGGGGGPGYDSSATGAGGKGICVVIEFY